MIQLGLHNTPDELAALPGGAVFMEAQEDQAQEGGEQVQAEQTQEIYAELLLHFQDRIRTNDRLERKLVSSQDDKERPFYSWFRYREGFSSKLVSYLLNGVHPNQGTLLD